MEIKPVARIHTDFPEKFGIPRQSNLVKEAHGIIVFEPEFSQPECVRGIEGYDYLWLVWGFDHGEKSTWSPTVRPPILGGNKRMGVFATRSPFRPNPLGLSSVRLESVETTDAGPVLHVLGADLRDGTEIYDIKPYVPTSDCHPNVRGGIATENEWHSVCVEIPDDLQCFFDTNQLETLKEVLALDPRPATHHDPQRTYAMAFADRDVHFTVDDQEGTLTVTGVTRR